MKQKTPIAVIGMSGIFPGAKDIATFWKNIENGVSAVCDVPDGRWILNPERTVSKTMAPDRTLSKRAGLIKDFSFDPSGLSVDHDLLEQLDPMYHLVLTAGRDALSGIHINEETKKRTGVILAAIALPTDSSSFLTRAVLGKAFEASMFGTAILKSAPPLTRAQCLASRVTALPAAITAKALGLHGGSFTLDAACSSSLYSIKLACDELRAGRADMMLAGGVSRPESLFTQAGFTQLKALSPSGICAPFDAAADGLVVGEGAGFIVLKRLSDAVRDNDPIIALIHGAGLSNDIGGNLLAPDTEGQIRAMRIAYQDAGWSPYDVDHIECHGTGTPVGDTIELKSMRAVWGESGWTESQCAIGSVKSMIGHLLTGAGIAGTIKTLLALKNKTLPPSLNFRKPAAGSPLVGGPFRVLSQANEWKRRDGNPRRAAMSAFGFGGINAHVLVEDFEDTVSKSYAMPNQTFTKADIPKAAVVGMGTFFGPVKTLKDFQDSVIMGIPFAKIQGSESRFRGTGPAAIHHIDNSVLPKGSYLEQFPVAIGEFHIPPNEIPDILPQHLMMLKASAQAMDDAGLSERKDRPEMGTAIGMSFDYEASNFNARWDLENKVREWNDRYGLGLDDSECDVWLSKLKDAIHPPLTAARTTGALGGIIASRVAKEFKLGGPSYIVSCEDASGLKALEIGLRSIQNGETDYYLVGAVDLPGEIRNIIYSSGSRPFSADGSVRPFDGSSGGTLPGEGAVALVLKRYDKAVEDGDRIYCVVNGIGKACMGGIDTLGPTEDAYLTSLETAFEDAEIESSTIGLVETHGSGAQYEDAIESSALKFFFSNKPAPVAVGAATPVTGHTGSAAGLTSVVKAALSLYQGIIPAFSPDESSANAGLFDNSPLYTPAVNAFWDNKDRSRRALVASMTTDGNVSHVILEEAMDARTSFRSIGTDIPVLKPLKTTKQVSPSPRDIHVTVGGKNLMTAGSLPSGITLRHPIDIPVEPVKSRISEITRINPVIHETIRKSEPVFETLSDPAYKMISEAIQSYTNSIEETAQAHARFIEFSNSMSQTFADTLNFQADLVNQILMSGDAGLLSSVRIDNPFMSNMESIPVLTDLQPVPEILFNDTDIQPLTDVEPFYASEPVQLQPVVNRPDPAFPREMCMEFAIGSIGKVLGPMFDIVDTYKVRVRLPDEPLMLVDRIMSVEGEKGSLKSGKVVTEHDVFPGAWYLDGGRCPVCISIEAGQADLFLCSYLGIDLAVKGKRSYRLLDAVAKFHSGLPKPGDTIRYEIKIDRFINQGETYLFFFHFNGFIGDKHIISMRKGCAGFFTDKEVKESGGIILTPEETAKVPGIKTTTWKDLVPFFGSGETYSLDDHQVDALRTGDAETAFGPLFMGKHISSSLSLPGGRMKLVYRVLSIEPEGGRYGLGTIRAQADIHPDDWFLTCHFVDDKVMPGTLMYECCMHTLRIFTMRMGWISDKEDVCCEPVPEVDSVLKCRGPVTVETKHVFYVVDIKEIGYGPEPYVLADAHMYAHDQHIVMFRDMSMKMSGLTQNDIEHFWGK